MRSFSVLFILLCFTFSCTPLHTYVNEVDKSRLPQNGLESGEGFFFMKEDGQKFPATKITTPKTGNHIFNRIIADGKTFDAPNDLIAFQNEKGYFKFWKDPKPTRYWKGKFVKRIRVGKMSLYYEAFALTQYGPEDYYYFEKEKDVLVPLNFKSFSAALSDNPAALQEFKRLFPKGLIKDSQSTEKSQNITAVVDLYNQ